VQQLQPSAIPHQEPEQQHQHQQHQHQQPDSACAPAASVSPAEAYLAAAAACRTQAPIDGTALLLYLLSARQQLLPETAAQYRRKFSGMLCGAADGCVPLAGFATPKGHGTRPYMLLHALDDEEYRHNSTSLDVVAAARQEYCALLPHWSFHVATRAQERVATDPADAALQPSCAAEAALLADCRLFTSSNMKSPLEAELQRQREMPRDELTAVCGSSVSSCPSAHPAPMERPR
jgi:hypothetical protein